MIARKPGPRRGLPNFLAGLALIVSLSSAPAAANPSAADTPPTPAQKATDLMVAEAAGGVVKIASAASAVEFSVTVVNTTSKPIGGIVARLSSFGDGRGGSGVAPRIGGHDAPSEPFALDAYAAKPVKLGVTLAQPGVYNATLWLGAGSAALVTTIQVTWPEVKPALTIGNLPPISLRAGESGKTSLVVTETAGVSALLPAPVLESVLYKPSDKVTVHAPGIALASAASAPIAAGGRVEVPVTFTGLSSAGRYEATLQIASPASAPVSRSVSIYVREGYGVAAFYIVLGVLVAFALRIYGTVLAPRLALETRAGTLFKQLRECRANVGADPIALSVVDAMQSALKSRWNTLAATARLVGSTELDLYDLKIPLLQRWLQLRAWLPVDLPPATATLARKTLADAQTALQNPSTTALEVAAQSSALGALPSILDRSVVDELRQSVASLQDELASGTDPKQIALLNDATTLAAQLPQDVASFAPFVAALAELRGKYADVLIDALRALLTSASPVTMDAALWTSTVSSVQALLDSLRASATTEAKVATYRNAFATLARRLSMAAHAEASDVLLAQPDSVGWMALQRSAVNLQGALQAKPPTAVLSDLTQLLADRAALPASPTPGRGRSGPAAQHTAIALPAILSGLGATAGTGLFDFIGFGASAQALTAPNAPAWTRWRETALGLLALVVIAGLAVGVGIKTLWADDWVWGGGTAYLVAFLWGAGLAGFSYDGVKGLFGRVMP